MAKSLVKLRAEIQRLQRSFDSVVATMKKDIAFHGLTVEDLFGSASSASTAAPAHAASSKGKSLSTPQSASARPPKYGDTSGNVWGGMGKRPAWLVAAMDAGKTKDSFLLSLAQSSLASGAPSAPSAKNAPAKKSPVKKAMPPKTAAPIAKVAAGKAMPVKAAVPAKKAVDLTVTPAKKAASGKAVTAGKVATPSKKPAVKSAESMKKPSSAIKKASVSAKAKTSKTVASEVATAR